ncbi:VQ motif-containing protein 4 [Impatiens glandulifera]|uniref:VQ motif-containing protein 4 n=1 Tax=Impatiens glandulifera TaxID=253017 RepID=UPI001FB06E60|nr:VQ motif-containing protein 4 [Impatiens glandulifera]
METPINCQQESYHHQSLLLPSPNSHNSSNSSSTTSSCSPNNNNINGVNHHQHHHHPSPTTPKPITRSEPNNPYPTTFVQADITSFKQVVQMLTGSTETAKIASAAKSEPPPKNSIPPIRSGPKKQTSSSSKLYERRNSMKNFKISPLIPSFIHGSVVSSEILSPSILDFPSLVLSPVTPLIPDPFNRSPQHHIGGNLNREAEEEAIARKGYFLHPSPRANTPRDSELRLLPLFPVTSPRVSGSSSSY